MILLFANSIIIGVISNLIFAFILVWPIQQLRYFICLKQKFHNRIVDTFWIRYPDNIVHSVLTTVKGNVILFKSIKNEDAFEGQFIMNPINLRIGEGYHFYHKSDGFGFMKVIIKDNDTIIVDAPYTDVIVNDFNNLEGHKKYQSFMWKKRKKST